MKTRRKHVLILAVAAVTVTGLFGLWRSAHPVGPKLAPELATYAVPANLMPRNAAGGPPPPGTSWEVYSVPMAYRKIVEAMKREPGWRATEGIDALSLAKASFFATEEGSLRQIDVRPGRLLFVEDLQHNRGFGRTGDHSVVTIAVPTDGTLMRSMTAFVYRLLGRSTAPVASKRAVVFLRDKKYIVSSPKPPKAMP